MLIKRISPGYSASIHEIKGFGEKQWRIQIVRLQVPPHSFIFSVEDEVFGEALFGLTATFFPDQASASAEVREWNSIDLTRFLTGIKDTAAYLQTLNSPSDGLTVENRISDNACVWTKFEEVEVPQGMFKKAQRKLAQFVNIEINGKQTGYIRWDEEILADVTKMLESIGEFGTQFFDEVERLRKA